MYLDGKPALREFVDLHTLAEIEDSNDWDATVVPLADGTLLVFDIPSESWSVREREAPPGALDNL